MTLWKISKRYLSAALDGTRQKTFGKLGTRTKPIPQPQDRNFDKRLALLSGLKGASRSKDLQRGKQLHLDAVESGYGSDLFVATAVVDMYANCGNMAEARKVFDSMQRHDRVSWNALILGYVENGDSKQALELFAAMQRQDCSPNARTFVAALMAYAQLASKEQGKEVDGEFVKSDCLKKGMELYSQAGSHVNVYVATAMVDLCAKCGSMKHARGVFDRFVEHADVGLWNALVLGYVENGEDEIALQLFSRMQRPAPDSRTFLAAIMACGNLAEKEDPNVLDGSLMKMKALETGAAIHNQAARQGFDTHIFVKNSLVDMYAKCGSLVDARRVFDTMPERCVISWTALMLAHVSHGEAELALELFWRMPGEGCEPDAHAFVPALMACARLALKESSQDVGGKFMKVRSLETGMAIHSQALRKNFKDIFIGTALIDMYAACRSMEDAQKVFDEMPYHDLPSWNTLITAYYDNSEHEAALELYERMRVEGCAPNISTFVTAINACSILAAREEGVLLDGKFVKTKCLERGMALHLQAVKEGFGSDMYVGGTLVEMYARCGSLIDACNAFQRMVCHNIVSWTVLIAAYTEADEPELGLDAYALMLAEGLTPNAQTYVAALKACIGVSDLQIARLLHGSICRNGLEDCPAIETSLVDSYGKCGSIFQAQFVFDSLRKRETGSYNALLSSYSHQGNNSRVFELFKEMQTEGVPANPNTFIPILASCSHAGLVEKGKRYFKNMQEKYGVDPRLEHYHCMVDMLGRANELDEALEIIYSMPFEPTSITWRTLLSASRTWKNREIGKIAYDALVALDQSDPAAYVLMANIYRADHGDEDDSLLGSVP